MFVLSSISDETNTSMTKRFVFFHSKWYKSLVGFQDKTSQTFTNLSEQLPKNFNLQLQNGKSKICFFQYFLIFYIFSYISSFFWFYSSSFPLLLWVWSARSVLHMVIKVVICQTLLIHQSSHITMWILTRLLATFNVKASLTLSFLLARWQSRWSSNLNPQTWMSHKTIRMLMAHPNLQTLKMVRLFWNTVSPNQLSNMSTRKSFHPDSWPRRFFQSKNTSRPLSQKIHQTLNQNHITKTFSFFLFTHRDNKKMKFNFKT